MLLRNSGGEALRSVRIVGIPVLLAAFASLAACQTPRPAAPATVQEERLPRSLEALRRRADAGEAGAARTLGVTFETGRGVRRDYAAALYWYERAAALGNPAAMFAAGQFYDTGRGVAPDRARAVEYYQRAAARGFGPAEYRLAVLTEKSDRAASLRLYKSAAAHGSAKAQQRLAALTGQATGQGAGQGGTPSPAFDQAQSSMLAEGVASGSPQALRHLEQAAQKQDALAQYDLGYYYENGIGLPVDKVKAFVWYKRAADGSGPPAAKAAAERGAKAVGERLSPEERTRAETLLSQPLAVSAPQ
ncbi:MAG: sel1 repeat family protein [Acetobacteraceae bacterium]|nr:sel1 repeat family protein [Acetobacteraceae bacterium]